MKILFTPLEVQRLTGLSYRQLQYWDRSGFLAPSARTGGNYRRYTFDDLILLELVKVLKDHHFSIQRLRDLFGKIRSMLPHIDPEQGRLTVFLDGERVMVFTGEMILDSHLDSTVVRFSVRELRDKIADLFPTEVRRQSAAG